MAKDPSKSEKIAVVTVHGTGDSADRLDGEKWYQRGSDFAEALKQKLSDRGVAAVIVPFIWTGGNSAHERETGAERLAATLRRLANKYAGVHVVGYSHGGNVAHDAAKLLRWGHDKRTSKSKPPISSLTTIGTPFLNSRSSALQSMGGLMFLAVTLLSVPLYAISLVLLILWALGETPYRDATIVSRDVSDPLSISNGPVGALTDSMTSAANLPLASGNWIFVGLWALVIGIPLWFMLRLALRGWRNTIRPRGAASDHARIFAVWHDNDEVISFLKQVECLPLQAFPSGSVLRSSRSAALNAGVITVVLAPLIAAIVTALPSGQIDHTWVLPLSAVGRSIVLALFVGPPLFALVYLTIMLFAASAGEFVARPRLNNWIADILRGIALGRDTDLAIGEVMTRSHTYATREYVLEGDLAQRMRVNAEGAAAKLIERYRWAIFSVGADTNGPLTSLATDAMTWSSLIHTTYFDQPEVLEVIASYIADEASTSKAPARAAEAATPPPPRARTGSLLAVAAGLVLTLGLSSSLAWYALVGRYSLRTPTTGANIATTSPPESAASAQQHGPAIVDCRTCPEMISIGPSSFAMGVGENDPGRQPWEGPQHMVVLRRFLISSKEVTFAEWDACVAGGGCNSAAEPRDGGWGRGDQPMIRVSWRDAQSYVDWLRRQTGKNYRLPSEAEWEFAARAGTRTNYWWGPNFEAGRTPRRRAALVASLGPNPFGLYDVTGNVGEWVQDCYVNTYAGAPTDGTAVQPARGCQRRVVRGGSWRDGPSGLRIAARSRNIETLRDASIGFRVARDVVP